MTTTFADQPTATHGCLRMRAFASFLRTFYPNDCGGADAAAIPALTHRRRVVAPPGGLLQDLLRCRTLRHDLRLAGVLHYRFCQRVLGSSFLYQAAFATSSHYGHPLYNALPTKLIVDVPRVTGHSWITFFQPTPT